MSVREVDQGITSIEHHGLGRVAAGFNDMLTMAQRNLIALVRVPQLLVFSTVQPIIFVLLFRYVFGGAVQGSLPPGVPYVEYLMPGVFVQTATFGALGSAIGLATDVKSGLLERFRSLPMARSAVLTGRTLGDLGRNVFVTILMLIVGFLVGFRILTPAWEATCGVLLLLFFGYMLSWIFATVGLWTGDPETAQAAAFPILAPLVFASSAFVPVSSMPSWLQGFAEHQPVSVTASAVRGLLIGQIPGVANTSWYVIQSLFWCVALIAIFAPLAVRRYRTAV
jgi:ABC-2 type transport system permease protein/oleandomycin transport system permease protein